MKRFRRGLVVGKFAPLHRGHQLVIDRAVGECDEVVLVSWTNPEIPGHPAERREGWLRALYPRAVVRVVAAEDLPGLEGRDPGRTNAAPHLDAERRRWIGGLPHDDDPEPHHRDFVAWLCLVGLGGPVDAVFTSESYGDAFAAALSERFRVWFPGSPRVRHVEVDRARSVVPISGTAIRADPHRHRELLDPVVAASFVRRAVLLGGESTGKSTLAATLADRLGTVHVAEYGRELWEEQGGQLELEDLLRIAREQIGREEAALRQADRWLICDTSPLTTLFYCREMFGRAEPELERLAERPYDVTFLCAPDFPLVQDGTRRDEAFRHRQHRWTLDRLVSRGIDFVLLEGSFEGRVERALGHLELE